MQSQTRIAILGAGVIGRRHREWLRNQPGCVVSGIADPSDAARDYCASRDIAWFADYRDLLDTRPDGVIVATPNDLHLFMGLECLSRGLPMLMEKPVADTVAAAVEFARAVAESDVPVLVGHYRRHSPIIIAARDIITAGELGRLISVSLRLMFLKPDDYFLPNWRSQPGAGPVLTNLIHDIDALRFMCGEVASVQAVTSNAARGFAVEDTAAVILTLANGAIVTANLSDSIPSPYSWDLNAAEEPSFPVNGKDVYLIGGSAASLALPSLCLWSYGSERGWMKPLQAEKRVVAQENPYVRQCTHFLRVVRKKEPPSVTVAESTRSQMVVGAIAEAARTGRRVDMTFS